LTPSQKKGALHRRQILMIAASQRFVERSCADSHRPVATFAIPWQTILETLDKGVLATTPANGNGPGGEPLFKVRWGYSDMATEAINYHLVASVKQVPARETKG